MKTLLTAALLSSASFLAADQYICPSRMNGGYSTSQSYSPNYYGDNYQNNTQQRAPRQQQYISQSDQYNSNTQQQPTRDYNQNQPRNGYDNTNSSNQTSKNDYAVSDQELSKKIEKALSPGWFSKEFENVTFDVFNGFVTLKGIVETIDYKNKAEDNVKKIDGVKQVNNMITVAEPRSSKNMYTEKELQSSEGKFPGDSSSTPEDRQLNARIREKLNGGWFSKGYNDLIIATSNGVVVISGTVKNPNDIKDINEQLKDIDGIKSVNNQANVKK